MKFKENTNPSETVVEETPELSSGSEIPTEEESNKNQPDVANLTKLLGEIIVQASEMITKLNTCCGK